MFQSVGPKSWFAPSLLSTGLMVSLGLGCFQESRSASLIDSPKTNAPELPLKNKFDLRNAGHPQTPSFHGETSADLAVPVVRVASPQELEQLANPKGGVPGDLDREIAIPEQTVSDITVVDREMTGTIQHLQAGDRICYVDFLDEQGDRKHELASFGICQRQDLIGQRVRLLFEDKSVSAESCQEEPNCDKNEIVSLIIAIEVLP